MTDNTADIDHLLDKEKDACKLAAASLVQVLMKHQIRTHIYWLVQHSDDTNLGYQTRSMQLFNVEGSAELENEIAKSLHRALKLKSSKIDREPRDQLLDASHTSSVLSAVCQSQPPQQPSQSRVVAHNPAAFEAAIEFSTDTSITSACLGHHNNTSDVYEAPQIVGGGATQQQQPVSPMSSVSLSTRIAQLDALSQRMYETQPHLTTSTLPPPPPLQTRSQPTTTTTQQVSTTTTTTVQQQLSASQPAAVDYGFSSSSSDEECETAGTDTSAAARQHKHSQPDDLFSSDSDSDNDDQSAQQQQQQELAAGDDQFLDEALLDETQPINNAAPAIGDQSPQSQQYLLHQIKPIDQLFSDSDEAE